jgi:orotidine-5'-phosphate decarboxylase
MMMKTIIVALDFTDINQAKNFVLKLDPKKCRVKVGKALFTLAGPAFIEFLHAKGFEVFLDLKFHDIPNTVKDACIVCAKMGIFMLTVHTMGGLNMLLAAKEGLAQVASAQTKLMGVTVLTSLDNVALMQIGVSHVINEQVLLLAGLANQAALDGVVCSAQEVQLIKQKYGNSLQLLTPGIRLQQEIDMNSTQDQKRVMTPRQALAAGSDYLVIGRSITSAADPAAVIDIIIKEQ